MKLLGLVDSGGMAKMFILNGEVKVDNVIENRIRRKLRAGDKVLFQGKSVRILA